MEMIRKRVQEHRIASVLQTKERFQDVLAELFFLQNGGNMMDLPAWKKKPPAIYSDYMKIHLLESENDHCDYSATVKTTVSSSVPAGAVTNGKLCCSSGNPTPVEEQSEPVVCSATESVTIGSTSSSNSSSNKTPAVATPSISSTPSKTSLTPATPVAVKNISSSFPSLMSSMRGLGTPHHSGVGRPPTTVMTPEQIVEKAKQVTYYLLSFLYVPYRSPR